MHACATKTPASKLFIPRNWFALCAVHDFAVIKIDFFSFLFSSALFSNKMSLLRWIDDAFYVIFFLSPAICCHRVTLALRVSFANVEFVVLNRTCALSTQLICFEKQFSSTRFYIFRIKSSNKRSQRGKSEKKSESVAAIVAKGQLNILSHVKEIEFPIGRFGRKCA